MSNNIERINTSFSNFLSSPQAVKSSKPYSRYSGGHAATNGPFISGYWYLLIELPNDVITNVSSGDTSYGKNLFNIDSNVRKSIKKYLHFSSESFNPPSKTINKGEVSGFGGIKKYIVLNQTITPTFSVSFYEKSGMPIHKIFKIWSNMFNSNYGHKHPGNHKGRLYAFLCKPTFSYSTRTSPSEEDVEEMFYFEGVFPENDGNDSLAANIAENNKIEYTMQFSFDSYYFGVDNSEILTDGIKSLRDLVGELTFDMTEIFPAV